MAKYFSVMDFFNMFPTDDSCLEHIMELRYGNPLDCPKCGKRGKFSRIRKMPAYQCAWCGHHIHPMAGTPFERSRTPLQKWFYAIYLFTTTRHGVSAKELQRQLGVTYKTAWRMGHEIRKYMADVDGNSPLSGHVEVDETFVGGKDDTPGLPSEFTGSNKTAVFGMVQRGGEIITKVVPNRKSKTLMPYIAWYVERGSRISTDDLRSYRRLNGLGLGYVHRHVNHSREEWVKGDTHTNTIEGFWSHFKCSVRGTHRAVSPQHMMKYLGEFEFRFNRRFEVAQNSMFDRLIKSF